jgi:uncharacterized delta-60 repeat protein
MTGSTTTLVLRGTFRAPAQLGLAALRRALRDRAMELAPPRIWMEALEPRRMLSGDAFGAAGWTHASFDGPDGYALPVAMAAAPNGAFYAVGCVGDSAENLGIARFLPDGSPDTSFGTDGSGTVTLTLDENCYGDRIVVQGDGKIIVSAECADGLAVARFNVNGTLDTSFGGGARNLDAFNGFPSDMITQEDALWLTPDGKVVIIAQQGAHVVTMRLTASGDPDEAFAPGGIATAQVDAGDDAAGLDAMLAAMPLPGGGALAYVDIWSYPPSADPNAGDYTNYDAQPTVQLVRVELDDHGNLVSQKPVDVALTPPDTASWGSSDYMLWLGADGSAFFTSVQPDPRVQKLDPGGNIDTSFGDHGLASVPGSYAQIRAITPDGRIVVQSGLDDTLTWGERDPDIVLRGDGSIDSTFNHGQPFGSGGDYAMLAQDDGSIILGYTSGVDAHPDPSFRLQKFLGDGSAPASASSDLLAGSSAGGVHSAAFSLDDNGLFADLVGASVWNPGGKRDVYDDAAA